jgi:hypothetical protein
MAWVVKWREQPNAYLGAYRNEFSTVIGPESAMQFARREDAEFFRIYMLSKSLPGNHDNIAEKLLVVQVEADEDDTPSEIHDADMYHECSKPFESGAVANKAAQSFFNEVYRARCRHRIADVHVVIRDQVVKDQTVMTDFHCGSAAHSEQMTAWAFGRAQAERQAAIARMVGEQLKNSIHLRETQP